MTLGNMRTLGRIASCLNDAASDAAFGADNPAAEIRHLQSGTSI
jgi:hypothetical protein